MEYWSDGATQLPILELGLRNCILPFTIRNAQSEIRNPLSPNSHTARHSTSYDGGLVHPP